MHNYLSSLLRNLVSFLPTIALVIFITFTPDLALAAPGGFVPCEGASCSACDFINMANKIIKWLFGIIFLLFAVLMLMAGFGLVTSGGDTSAVSAAKSKFQNALIGLLIVMAAWLMVDTLLRGLIKGGKGDLRDAQFTSSGPWAEVKCQVQTVPKEATPQPDSGITATTTIGGVFKTGNINSLQNGHKSPALISFQNCVASKMESGTYIITSISDDKIASGLYSFPYCAKFGQSGGCAHTVNSCHYGGRNCTGSSYALDIFSTTLSPSQISSLLNSSTACGGWGQVESNGHVHISIGESSGCGCN